MSNHSLKRDFDSGCAEEIARRLLPVLQSFDAEGFVSAVDEQVGPLELISKDHPDLAVDLARRWLVASPTERTHWIVNHGMPTLVKRGHPAALEVVGAR